MPLSIGVSSHRSICLHCHLDIFGENCYDKNEIFHSEELRCRSFSKGNKLAITNHMTGDKTMSFFENTRKPVGIGGKLMVSMMNLGHQALAHWGLQFLTLSQDARVLDCGCGGGANIKNLLKRCPQGVVKGIDYSAVSVEKARRLNAAAISDGRCVVWQGSVSKIIFATCWFDVVTAFETVYFWPELSQCFREIYRVLKPGGMFLICNECSGDTDKDEKWTKRIGGMTVYRDVELEKALGQAGFQNIRVHKNRKGWLCVTAMKPDEEGAGA